MWWLFFLWMQTAYAFDRPRCFTDQELTDLEIYPSDRAIPSEMFGGDPIVKTIRGAVGDWETSYVNYELHRIMLEEAQAYTFEAEDKIAFFSAMNWMLFMDDEIDVAFEVWDNAVDMRIDLTILSDYAFSFGDLGYEAQSGFYMGEETMDSWNIGGSDKDFADYWKTLLLPEVIAEFQKVDHFEYIKSHPDLIEEMNTCADVENGEPWNPIEIFAPTPSCEDLSECFQIPSVMAYYDPNFYQSLFVNLQMKAYLVFWGPCRHKILIRHMLANNVKFVFWWSEPNEIVDILLKPIKMINFPRPSSECFTNWNTSNLAGLYSTVNCDFPLLNILKIGKSAVWGEKVFADGRLLISRSRVSIQMIQNITSKIYQMGGTVAPFDRKIMFDASCDWLKNNVDVWTPWVENTYSPPTAAIDISIALFVVFGVLLVMIGGVYLASSFQLFELVGKDLMNDFFIYCVALAWKSVDFASTVVATFVEINPNPDVSVDFKFLMLIFFVLHLVCFIYTAWTHVIFIWWLRTDAHTTKLQTMQKFKSYESSRIQYAIDIAVAGMMSFVFEDAVGGVLQTYALIEYPELLSAIYVICLVVQIIEAGMSVESFYEYSVEYRKRKKLDEKIAWKFQQAKKEHKRKSMMLEAGA